MKIPQIAIFTHEAQTGESMQNCACSLESQVNQFLEDSSADETFEIISVEVLNYWIAIVTYREDQSATN